MYGLKSWKYFAPRKRKKPPNDIRIKAGTNEVKNKVCLLKIMISQFMVAAACCFCCFYQFLDLSFYSFHTCIMNYDTFLVFNF